MSFLFSRGVADAIVIAPAKKKTKTETDYQNCAICQKKLATEASVATPKLNSIANKYGDPAVAEFVQRTLNKTASVIYRKYESYHQSYYKQFSSRSKLDQVIDRFQKAEPHKKPSLSQIKIG